MNKIIGVTELQRSFRAVFDEVARRRTPYILMRGSRPEAALISYEDYLRFQQLQEAAVLDRFDRLVERMEAQNKAFSEEEVEADVRKAAGRGRRS
ncbi:MAG: type II toxin-antitoxin system Phd/YefM family antitoxin [Chloroflexota bacterium]